MTQTKKKFIVKLVLICMVHVAWAYLFLVFALSVDSFDDWQCGISFFLTEPWVTTLLWPLFAYIQIRLIIKKYPIDNKKANRALWAVSIVLSIWIIGYNLLFYIEWILEDGFSVFLYKDYWQFW